MVDKKRILEGVCQALIVAGIGYGIAFFVEKGGLKAIGEQQRTVQPTPQPQTIIIVRGQGDESTLPGIADPAEEVKAAVRDINWELDEDGPPFEPSYSAVDAEKSPAALPPISNQWGW